MPSSPPVGPAIRSGGTCATVFTYLTLPARDPRPLPSAGLTLGDAVGGRGYDISRRLLGAVCAPYPAYKIIATCDVGPARPGRGRSPERCESHDTSDGYHKLYVLDYPEVISTVIIARFFAAASRSGSTATGCLSVSLDPVRAFATQTFS